MWQRAAARTSKAQAEAKHTPPAEKAAVVLHHGREAGVGPVVQPAGQFREAMADGFEKDPGQGYDLPRWRRWAVTCV